MDRWTDGAEWGHASYSLGPYGGGLPSCEGGQQARWLRPPLLQAQHSAEISACPARVCPACARENRDDRLRSHRMSGCRDVVSVSHGCAACTVRTNAATRRWESAGSGERAGVRSTSRGRPSRDGQSAYTDQRYSPQSSGGLGSAQWQWLVRVRANVGTPRGGRVLVGVMVNPIW